MKRLLVIAILLLCLSAYAHGEAVPEGEAYTNVKITDIPDGHWAKAAVERSAKIMRAGTEFHGEGLLTRYEEAIIICELLNKYGDEIKVEDGTMEFQILDVPPSHPVYGAILVSLNSGIHLTFDNKFYGEKYRNRFQVAVVLDKLMDMIGIGSGNSEEIEIKDVERSHWAYPSVQIVVGRGLMKLEEGKFNGKKLFTRYEEAFVIDRILDAMSKPRPSSADEEVSSESSEENNFEMHDEIGSSLGEGILEALQK